ncbi:MAG TPA: hypothetical protein PL051_02670 [Candidatus Saccharibacteria bacterium]|nr:hypothetical protein [Candidatus Saccharibacteria bacterium]
MEKYDPISEWLYYIKGVAIADIPDKRIMIGIANVMDDDGVVDVFQVEGEEATENFTDYIVDSEAKLEFYRKVLAYFARTGAPELTEEQAQRYQGLKFIIGEDS